jgi:hypothetical protein
MAGAWHGGLAGADQYVKDPQLRASISLAMGYWFANDFQKNPACLDSGGTATCPCGTPGLWNTVSLFFLLFFSFPFVESYITELVSIFP